MTAEHIQNSIDKAVRGESNLTEKQLAVGGFSTVTMRHLWNNLCNIKGAYLEVGLWTGGTFTASFNKDCVSIGIENFQQDFSVVGVKEILEKNLEENKDRAKEVIVHYEDCFKIDKSLLPDNIDILFYDGIHHEFEQSKALPAFLDKMANRFLYVVDDFGWKEVFDGTNKGLSELKDKIEIEKCWVLRGYYPENDSIWHNQVAIYLINKKQSEQEIKEYAESILGVQ
jgi:hypothetical protein